MPVVELNSTTCTFIISVLIVLGVTCYYLGFSHAISAALKDHPSNDEETH